MRTRTTFSRHYCAGLAGVFMAAAAGGLALTGERYSGLSGASEIVVLLVAATLVVASDLTVSHASRAVTLTLAVVALEVMIGLVVLNLAAPVVGSVVTMEAVAAGMIGLYLTQVPCD